MAGLLSTFVQSFSPLRYRNFRIYVGGQAISLIGTWLQATAQGWLVWQLTGSEAVLGVVTMLNSLPLLLLGPWAGVWADRWDRRRLLIGTQVTAMLLAFSLAVLVQTHQVQLWHVLVMTTILGVVTALDAPAQQAFLGDLSGMGEVRKAVNVNAMIFQLSRMLGPMFAGFLIARIGNAPAFWLNGLSFLAVVASLVAVRSEQVRSNKPGAKPLAQIGDALRFVKSQPRLQEMFFCTTLMTVFFWSIVLNMLPSVADKLLGGNAETLGTLQAAAGAGALVGVLFVVPYAQAARRGGVVLGLSGLWVGIWLFIFSFARLIGLAFLALAMASLAVPVIFTTVLGLTQLLAPADMRARLLSLFNMLSFGLQPFAALFVGTFAEKVGVPPVIQFNALMILIGAAGILTLRADFRGWIVTSTPVIESSSAD